MSYIATCMYTKGKDWNRGRLFNLCEFVDDRRLAMSSLLGVSTQPNTKHMIWNTKYTTPKTKCTLPDIKYMLLSTKYTRNKSFTKRHGIVKHLCIALHHLGTKYHPQIPKTCSRTQIYISQIPIVGIQSVLPDIQSSTSHELALLSQCGSYHPTLVALTSKLIS